MSGTTCLEPEWSIAKTKAHAAAPAIRVSPGGAATVLMVGLLLLGGAVRLRHFFAAPSYWYDEAYLLVNVFEKSYAELAGPLRLNQAAPPLYLWALHSLYLLFGSSEWAMRLPALIASLLAMLVAIPLARRVAGPASAPWIAGFVALSHHALTHAVEVKPYIFDLLFTELIFLATASHLANRAAANDTRCPRWPLLALALLSPWASYPSCFALAGAGLALFIGAALRRELFKDFLWLVFATAVGLSAVLLWACVARHQRSSYLEDYWNAAFLDLSSLPASGLWISQTLIQIGDYGTTGMGIPLLLLSVAGGVSLLRRSLPLALMLLGQLASAGVAAALRLYPLDDRLLFFAVPTLWLLAAIGIGAILNWVPERWGWIAVLFLAIPLYPGVVRYAYHLAVVPTKTEFREAFAFVRAQQRTEDQIWVSHAEVFEVYYGTPNGCLGPFTPADELLARIRGRRVWLVSTPPWRGRAVHAEFVKQLTELGYVLSREESRFSTLVVLLYEPPNPSQ